MSFTDLQFGIDQLDQLNNDWGGHVVGARLHRPRPPAFTCQFLISPPPDLPAGSEPPLEGRPVLPEHGGVSPPGPECQRGHALAQDDPRLHLLSQRARLVPAGQRACLCVFGRGGGLLFSAEFLYFLLFRLSMSIILS